MPRLPGMPAAVFAANNNSFCASDRASSISRDRAFTTSLRGPHVRSSFEAFLVQWRGCSVSATPCTPAVSAATPIPVSIVTANFQAFRQVPDATPTLISHNLMPGDELPEDGPVGNTAAGILVGQARTTELRDLARGRSDRSLDRDDEIRRPAARLEVAVRKSQVLMPREPSLS